MSESDRRKAGLLKELRRQGVTDARVLAAIEAVPRPLFLPDELLRDGWENVALPIGAGQTISQPLIVGLMTQALNPQPTDRILEIGTGSGYQAAILAQLCAQVYSVERIPSLLAEAQDRFRRLGYENIATCLGDGHDGWPDQAPFDGIIVTAAASDVPPALTRQLKQDSVLVVPVALDAFDQQVIRIRKSARGLEKEALWPVRFVPLVRDPSGPDGAG